MEFTAQEERLLFPVLSRSGPLAPDPLALNVQLGLMVASAVNVAVKLGLADLLETPKMVDVLARETQTHARSLYHLLRALEGINIFREIDAEHHLFENTDRSRLLKKDAMADLVTLWGAEYQWNSWRDLLYTIQTGKPALAKHYGTGATIWTYLNTHPQDSQAFQRGLTVNARLIIPSLLATYDFSGVRKLVDLGGGHGELVVSLLHRYPHLTATLFDRASVIAEVQERMHHQPQDIRARSLLEPGSFFETVPPGADCYVIKNVLMDWSDTQYLQILRGCRQALDGNAGHLLVVEPVISETASFTKFFSLQMSMMMNAAHHRSVEEHRVLFEQAGFHLTQAIPLGLEQVLLEGTPFARASKEVAP